MRFVPVVSFLNLLNEKQSSKFILFLVRGQVEEKVSMCAFWIERIGHLSRHSTAYPLLDLNVK